MKPKEFQKRLVVNKKTVAHLNNGEMKVINGGALVETAGICPSPEPLPTAAHYHTCDPACGTAPSVCDSYTGNPQSNPCCPTC